MNVQQTIIKGIKEQLFFNDYLVLPNFGGFVLQSQPARFSGSVLILPASKTVSFNVQLKQNDGILTFWLQEKLKCTAAESTQHLIEFAEFSNSILSAKRRLTLGGIGFLYLDFENNLCFEPQLDTNFLSSSFGLAPVSLKEFGIESVAIQKEQISEDRKAVVLAFKDLNHLSLNYKKVLLAASIIILLFATLLLFVSNTRMSGQLNASLFGTYAGGSYQPVKYKDLSLISPENKNMAYVADANGIALLELSTESKIAVKATNVYNVANETKKHSFALKKGYEIVLGCFGVHNNAKRMAAKLSQQNINVDISEKNEKGLYTVSNGTFSSKAEALFQLKEIQHNFPKAWIKNL